MRIKRFNESLRDKMVGKSMEELKITIDDLTPFGVLKYLEENDIDDEEVTKYTSERIENSKNNLNYIFDTYKKSLDLESLVTAVSNWVEENGGNHVNITNYGTVELAELLSKYNQNNYMSGETIYEEETIELFKKLIKNMALCEVTNNNYDNYEN